MKHTLTLEMEHEDEVWSGKIEIGMGDDPLHRFGGVVNGEDERALSELLSAAAIWLQRGPIEGDPAIAADLPDLSPEDHVVLELLVGLLRAKSAL
jgi:hypothetical protein